MKHAETYSQVRLVAHLYEFLPSLLFWHTPNGEPRPGGVGIRLMRLGVRAGVPDLFFPTLGNKGLFVEMKDEGEHETKAQEQVRVILELAGFECYVYDDWRAAFAFIEQRAREQGYERSDPHWKSGELPASR